MLCVVFVEGTEIDEGLNHTNLLFRLMQGVAWNLNLKKEPGNSIIYVDNPALQPQSCVMLDVCQCGPGLLQVGVDYKKYT